MPVFQIMGTVGTVGTVKYCNQLNGVSLSCWLNTFVMDATSTQCLKDWQKSITGLLRLS